MTFITDRPPQTLTAERSTPEMVAIALTRPARTSALDRMLMRASLALYLWARRRAVRRGLAHRPSHEEHARQLSVAAGIAAREHEHELRWARLR